MEPQRLADAGPMAPSSLKNSRKTHDTKTIDTNSTVKEEIKEIVTVQTSAPTTERRGYRIEKRAPIYTGEVNLRSIIETNKDMMCCSFTENNDEMAVGFTDGVIRMYDSHKGVNTISLVDDECQQYPGPVTAIKHRPVSTACPVQNMLISSYVTGCVKCWKYQYAQCLFTIREKRQTLGCVYHPRCSKFVTFGDDAKLNLYDEEAQTQERAFYESGYARIDGHTSRIFACAFNRRSRHEMVSGGWDNTVLCWDDRVPYATRYFTGVHMCGEGLDYDKAGQQILTCSWQETDNIQIWDYGSCKLIETIKPDLFDSKLYCGKFVPKTNYMVCGGSDGNMLRVVDLNYGVKRTVCSIRNVPGSIYGFDFGAVRRRSIDSENRRQDLHEVPCVAFVSGKKLICVDFGL